ncbi:ABC transporter ATP-binding protein [Calidifontibacter indicus]|uniref:Spermidine/putrescine transport system ATP-binding protein n=1 Tax=Calidifontibacter indicus TaxID=419650 RepID=A0A3D9UN39_9MICO|nr:ABC transporter ATP-binding protein [Calidifontibacter indicus]REF30706.1 spermidine/putrescine transport system ATP-binding protein [Calidifontibacter indicus]
MGASDALRKATGDLRLESVTKEFADFTAVDSLDLVVPRGSFFALLGPSGCGKTTTLRMVAGLEQPTSGRVLIGDTDLTGSRPYERPVNTVFQSYALFPHLTVRDNVAFGPKRRGVKDALAQADSTLDLVQLTHLAKRKPQQLSGGQQQRVAVARALVNQPEVLLLDEPLGALDLKLRREMQVELKRIQTEVGLTFIHVTHDQEEAMTMADTVAVMNAGRIEQMGAPEALYDLPKTAFVATFLGQSNLTKGTASKDGDWVTFAYAQERFGVPAARAAKTSGEVLLGVRPEKCRVHETNPGPSTEQRSVMGPATVLDVSFIGVATNYLVRSPAGNTWAIYEQNMDVEPQHLKPGDDVWVSWAPQHAFIVDDGERALLDEEAAS